jgi:hypothetical protein
VKWPKFLKHSICARLRGKEIRLRALEPACGQDRLNRLSTSRSWVTSPNLSHPSHPSHPSWRLTTYASGDASSLIQGSPARSSGQGVDQVYTLHIFLIPSLCWHCKWESFNLNLKTWTPGSIVIDTGLGLGTIFLTQEIPVPKRCTRHSCLYPCIIGLIYSTFESIILYDRCLSIFFNCFVFLFLSVSHCDVTKHIHAYSRSTNIYTHTCTSTTFKVSYGYIHCKLIIFLLSRY